MKTRPRWVAYWGRCKEPYFVADLRQDLEAFKSTLYARGLATYGEIFMPNRRLRFERVVLKVVKGK